MHNITHNFVTHNTWTLILFVFVHFEQGRTQFKVACIEDICFNSQLEVFTTFKIHEWEVLVVECAIGLVKLFEVTALCFQQSPELHTLAILCTHLQITQQKHCHETEQVIICSVDQKVKMNSQFFHRVFSFSH